MQARGLREKITLLMVPTYGSSRPKSVVRVIMGGASMETLGAEDVLSPSLRRPPLDVSEAQAGVEECANHHALDGAVNEVVVDGVVEREAGQILVEDELEAMVKALAVG